MKRNIRAMMLLLMLFSALLSCLATQAVAAGDGDLDNAAVIREIRRRHT